MPLRKFIESTNNAIEGILHTARTQRHLRYHLFAAASVLIITYILGIDRTDFLIISIAVILVLLSEMMNTAVEYVVDLLSPEYSEQARIAKDIAAGAVFITAFGAVVVGYIVLFPYFEKMFKTGIHITYNYCTKGSNEDSTCCNIFCDPCLFTVFWREQVYNIFNSSVHHL